MKAKDYSVIQAQIYHELDQAKGPLTKDSICQRVSCSSFTFDQEKKALIKTGDIYLCAEGYVLKEYATYDQQLWHLSWSLGLLETSAIHVTLDKELLELAPQALQVLISTGKMDAQHGRKLRELQNKLKIAMAAPKLLLQTYNNIQGLLDDHFDNDNPNGSKIKLNSLKDLKKFKKKFDK